MSHQTILRTLVAMTALVWLARGAVAQVDSPAAQVARTALRELHTAYDRYPDWYRWLRQPRLLEVEYELTAGDRAEPAAMAAVATQLRAGAATYFRPPVFARLATSLETRVKELTPVARDQWAAACLRAGDNYAPVTPVQLFPSKRVLAQRLDALERRLPGLRRPGDEWREFLYWPEIRWLTTSDAVDPATLDRLETRWAGAPTIWNEPPLVEAALAVRTYIRQLRAATAQETQDQHRAAWSELAELVASPGQTSSDNTALAAALARRERLGQSSSLTASIRRELSRPNIVLRARTAWLASLFARRINDTFSVDDVFAGARSVGSGTLSGATRCEVLPSGALGHWVLRMDGNSRSSTTGYGDRVQVASRAATQIHAETPITIDVRGLSAGRTTARASTSITYDSIDASGMRRRRTEAVRQTYARRPQAEAEASEQARRSVIAQMQTQATELTEKLSQAYRQQLRDRQVDANRMPPEVRVRTTPELLSWQCRVEGPASFAASSAPAEFEPEADVVLSFAASAMEEQAAIALGSRQLTANEFAKALSELMGDAEAAPTGQDFQAVFAEQPCDIELADGQLRVRFHITAFESADVQYPAMTVESVYQVDQSDGKLSLVRQGGLQVKPLARGDSDATRLSGRQQTLRLAAERKLNKAMAERMLWNGPPQPAAGEAGPRLRLRRAQAEGGWLQLALSAENVETLPAPKSVATSAPDAGD